VLDSTDAVLPGATVTLVDEGTGRTKTAVTNETADSPFRDLNFGSYQVTVKLQGFQAAIYNKVIVEAGRTTDIRVRLSVGGVEQNITVEGKTPVLEMSSERHFEHAEQQGRERAPDCGPQCIHARASRAGCRGAAGHREHALQRHAGRHDQSDDRRRQQLLETDSRAAARASSAPCRLALVRSSR
jgi:hypothetical protein